MSKQKNTSYLITFEPDTNERFRVFQEKLGWNKRYAILKLLLLFCDAVKELCTGRELVISVREETSKKVIIEKTSSFDSLYTP